MPKKPKREPNVVIRPTRNRSIWDTRYAHGNAYQAFEKETPNQEGPDGQRYRKEVRKKTKRLRYMGVAQVAAGILTLGIAPLFVNTLTGIIEGFRQIQRTKKNRRKVLRRLAQGHGPGTASRLDGLTKARIWAHEVVNEVAIWNPLGGLRLVDREPKKKKGDVEESLPRSPARATPDKQKAPTADAGQDPKAPTADAGQDPKAQNGLAPEVEESPDVASEVLNNPALQKLAEESAESGASGLPEQPQDLTQEQLEKVMEAQPALQEILEKEIQAIPEPKLTDALEDAGASDLQNEPAVLSERPLPDDEPVELSEHHLPQTPVEEDHPLMEQN